MEDNVVHLHKIQEPKAGRTSFMVDGKEYLSIEPDGTFKVKGEVVTKNYDVFYAFYSFLGRQNLVKKKTKLELMLESFATYQMPAIIGGIVIGSVTAIYMYMGVLWALQEPLTGR